MAMENNAAHLAYVKAQLKQLKSGGGSWTWVMVFNRSTRQALLHVSPGDLAGRLKTPRVIHQRLLKTPALKPKGYAAFFRDKTLVSSAGQITWEGPPKEARFVLVPTSGKGTVGDLQVGLRFFKRVLKDYTLKQPPEPGSPVLKRQDAVAPEAPSVDFSELDDLAALLGGALDDEPEDMLPPDPLADLDALDALEGLDALDALVEHLAESEAENHGVALALEALKDGVTAEDIRADVYAFFHSAADLGLALHGLREAIEDPGTDPARRAELLALEETLIAARDELDGWVGEDEGGPLGLAEGFAELVTIGSIDEAIEDLIADAIDAIHRRWKDTIGVVRDGLAPYAAEALAAAEGLDASQDPGGLRQLSALDEFLTTILGRLPQGVENLLRRSTAEIQRNPGCITAIRSEVLGYASGTVTPMVSAADEHFGLGLRARLQADIAGLGDDLEALRRRIASAVEDGRG